MRLQQKRTLRDITCKDVASKNVEHAAKKRRASLVRNDIAETLGERLEVSPVYLTEDGESWYLLAERWMRSNPKDFREEWEAHPTLRHPLKLFGKTVYEKRWSQSWGYSYAYSGSVSVGKPIAESSMVGLLVDKANELTSGVISDDPTPYNMCLQNWYQPEDTIGLHADDEKSLRPEYPIFSLSWGGTRRFLFRPRNKNLKVVEIYLKDGDLLVMGGTCQQTHRHEVPKRRVTMDPETAQRVNWTIRAFRDDGACSKVVKGGTDAKS